MKSQLEERMKDEIRKANFNVFEWTGFQAKPELALIAGMSLGYLMALEDFEVSNDNS